MHNMKDVGNMIEFVKNELASFSFIEYLTIDFSKEIIIKLKKEFAFSSTEELRSFILENGPNIFGFTKSGLSSLQLDFERSEEKIRVKGLNKTDWRDQTSIEELIEQNQNIRTELKIYPCIEMLIEDESKRDQVGFLLDVLFHESLKTPYKKNGFCNSMEEKNNCYEISIDRVEGPFIYYIGKKYCSKDPNGDIKYWREELLEFFEGKLPEVTPKEKIGDVAPALISIKNGLLHGQSIVTEDNTIYLHLSDGIMACIKFYKKKVDNTNVKIHSSDYFFTYRKDHTLYTTGGYDTKVALPHDIIFTTKNNVILVSFDASPLLMGHSQFPLNGIAPVIEQIRREEEEEKERYDD